MHKTQKNRTIIIFRSCGELAGTERTVLKWCQFIDFNKVNVSICSHKGNFRQIFKEQIPKINFVEFFFDDGKKGINRFLRTFRNLKILNVTKTIWLFNGMGGFSFWDIFASWIVTRGNVYISHHGLPIKFTKVKPRLWLGFLP